MKKTFALLSLLSICQHTPALAVTTAAKTPASRTAMNTAKGQKQASEPLLIKEDQQVARLVRWVNSNPVENERLGSINISIDKTGHARNVKFGREGKSSTAAAALRAMQFPSDANVKERRIKIQFMDLPSAPGSKLSQRVRTVTTCGGVASGG